MDPTAVVASITAAVTTVSAIGVAILSLVVTIKLFKWVQRVL
ncbi:MAG: major capsid protein [Burkholderiales bacterium]